MLENLGPYTRAAEDLSAFNVVLEDVERSLVVGDVVDFDLSVLATVIRHASILGCWVLGEPCFGRTWPVDHFAHTAIGDSRAMAGFADLYGYRLYYDERIRAHELVRIRPSLWVRRAKTLLVVLQEVINGHSGNVLGGHR